MDTSILFVCRERNPHLRILAACRRAASVDSRWLGTLPVIANAALLLSLVLFLLSFPLYYRDAWALLAFVFWGRSTAAVVAGLIIGLTVHSAHHCLAPRHQSLATQTESFAARFTAALIPVPAAANYDGPPIPGDIPQLILTACRRAAATESQRLRRGLNGLATIASSAPFFGFLGTSIGIVNSFRGGSGERTAMMAAIAHHLAEALLLTAWSLALAVLAHAAHRALKKQHRALELQMESCALALAKL